MSRIVTVAALLIGASVASAQTAIEHSTNPVPVPRADGVRVFVGGILREDDALCVELLEAAGAAAVALGYEDLEKASKYPKTLASAKIPFVCANARGAARPYVVREANGRRMAFVGITKVPAYRTSSVALDDPAAVLPKVVADAAAESDVVVLLAVMDRVECADLLRKVPGIHVALVPSFGTNSPEPVTVGASTLVQSPSGAVGRLVLDKTQVKENRFEALVVTEEERARLRETYRKHGGKELASLFGKDEPPVRAEPRPLASMEAGKSHPLAFVLKNRSAEVRFLSARLDGQHGGVAAPEGSAWLILDSEWTNIIPMTYVFERQVPTMYMVPKMGDHLYVVVNGTRLSRVNEALTSGPGGIAEDGFGLKNLGSKKRGVAVFEVPAAGLTSLEVRFYDYAHGHMMFDLLRAKDPEPANAKTGKNEVMEAGIYGVKKSAADGRVRIEIEFLARSVFVQTGDATAFDPKAKPGQKIKIGTVCDWKESRKYAHLLVDGECALRPDASSTLDDEPRFLPDRMTGGTLVFLVPEKYSSLELRCDFPNAQPPEGAVIHPKPLLFPVEGTRPAPPKRTAIAKVVDDCFLVEVVEQSITKKFAGEETGEEANFLVLDVTVRNSSAKGEWFQTADQLKYATEGGEQLPLHEGTYRGPRPATELVWIPAGETRFFQVLFEIPAGDLQLRLAYSGVSKAEMLKLRPLGEKKPTPKKRACPKCKEPAAADDEYCQSCGAKIGK